MVHSRNIGLNFKGQQALIRLWAPIAKIVAIKTNTYEPIAMLQEDYGYWLLQTDKVKPGDKYWFVIDGRKELADPASLSQPDDVHGAAMAIDLHYNWNDGHWKNIDLNDYIIYELHTGTFSPEGNFQGITARLDHLIALGITAIELMPVAAFPGSRNWGYDGVFPFAVQQSYGGATALQDLVSACHQKGLAVILDVVYNHVGPEGNYLAQFGPYFTDKYSTPWGDAVNFDDQDCDGVREFIVENALMWFRDFHIDALRLDAVHAIKDFSALHILEKIRLQTDELMKLTGRAHYLIVESDLNDPKYITSSPCGLGMDAQWADEFHHALRVTAGEKRMGYYRDFNGIEHLAKSYTSAYVYTGDYSVERRKTFGRAAKDHPGQQFIVFSQNHDQVGNRMSGERSSTLYGFQMQKVMAAAVLCAPYLPLLFMGEEYGETNPFLYFVSHTDPALIEMVRKGRKEEFAAMHSQGEAPDPQSEETFLASKLNWELLSAENHQALFQFYRHMISLRKSFPALCGNDRSACKVHLFKDQRCLFIERGLTGNDQLVVCLMNFSTQEQSIALPPGIRAFRKIADTAFSEEEQTHAAPTILEESQEILLQPISFIAYAATYG
ncbi:malto-oligosyltrehalose trehalohydrolase [Pedobacter immunditicola]|uniref:malto-oligosyltrehalose trehalohydrolase n=1 Tax=Pedobacter immunditicola TaxID=3133440 RepID=UPI0030ACC660